MTSLPAAGADDRSESGDRVLEPVRGLGASLSADEFKALFRGHPGGVAVITAYGPDGPVALTATSVASVSAEPPLLIFSISALSSATPTISNAESIVVHLLDADDLHLAKLGATSGVDRFGDESSWTRLPTGEPVYLGVRAWVRCVIVNRMDAGGSTVIAAHAVQASIGRDIEPGQTGNALVHHNRTWHRLGEHSRLD
ncbi:flavin reductase family protein [Microbacterium pygmaeum]|uniref:NADH-FMN oxidoreductase RutF, flavin reductase (DIM6/NTAB) family n=1 Tax=Microbacterium pygmaeum TaxID=370764 RepID=A0A1G7TTM7_9MICO|nr:flavin reductase family protein [Microbacterium pygmaeum]SDG38628.1 NADH-FMN oxidoreductase RutF, flavin reductase (DIM6/NTAB) family [Microbacterium pygmaeum]